MNISPILNDNCTHENVYTDKDIITCIDCGEEIFQKILHEKDWKYSNTDVYNVGGIRKAIPDERSIDKDVEYLNFNEAVVVQANKFYREVTKGKFSEATREKGMCLRVFFTVLSIWTSLRVTKNLFKCLE